MARKPEIVMVAEASEEHPRNGTADVIELNDGSLFMVRMQANRGKNLRHAADDEAPHDLVSMRSYDGGRTWGSQQDLITHNPEDHAAYKGSFLRLKNGEILFRYERFHRHTYGESMCVSAFASISTDECETFSAPAVLWSRKEGQTGSHGDLRQLRSGRIVVPATRLSGYERQDDDKDHSVAGCFLSDDGGKTWTQGGSVNLPLRGAMEGKIEQMKDGRLLMVMRTQLGAVFQSTSADEGMTWSKPQTTGLSAPESCPALRRIPQTGDLLIVWNHSTYDPNFDGFGLRSPLSVAISKDEAESWDKIKNIETDPEWEFTNPAAMITVHADLLIWYEASKYESLTALAHGNTGRIGRLGRSRMHLKLAIVDLNWLYE